MVGHDVQMRKIQNRHAMVAGAHCENPKIATSDSKRSERESVKKIFDTTQHDTTLQCHCPTESVSLSLSLSLIYIHTNTPTMLHSRKRTTQASSTTGTSNNIVSMATVQTAQRLDMDAFDGERRRSAAKTVRFSYVAILAFLSLAAFLGYMSVLHAHRTTLTMATNGEPWRHTGLWGSSVTGFHHYFGKSPRYVTVVLPSVVAPKKRKRRLDAIADTWGPLANAIYVVHDLSVEYPAGVHQVYGYSTSTTTDGSTSHGSATFTQPQHPADPYGYPQVLLVPPNITFDDGLPRLEYVMRFIQKHIDPDFAFFVNDHTYVIPEHACRYLRDLDPAAPLYAGHALSNHKEAFNSGAAGYFLSRQSLTGLVHSWNDKAEYCVADQANNWLQGNPGLVTARCLHHHLNTPALDTRDDHHHHHHHSQQSTKNTNNNNNKRAHRFHAFPIVRMVQGKVDEWYVNKHGNLKGIGAFDDSYAELPAGPDCCSKETISFHYVEAKENLALFTVRQELLREPTMTDEQLKSLVLKEWPSEWDDIGGYSRGLPHESDTDNWAALLTTLRKISSRHTQMDC